MATLEEKYQRKITRAQVAKDHTIYKIEKYRDSLATDKDMVLGDIVGGAMVAALFLTTTLIPANVLLCPVISFARLCLFSFYKQPQLLVIPETKQYPVTTHSFPHSHLQRHKLFFDLGISSFFKTVKRPNCVPISMFKACFYVYLAK